MKVPIILTSNTPHKYFQQETHLKTRYFTEENRKSCEELEAHRVAFHNRMEFAFLGGYHLGTETFPYDEFDLAKYLLSLYDD